MNLSRRLAGALLLGAVLVSASSLAACGSTQEQPPAGDRPVNGAASPGGGSSNGRDACLAGTWTVDLRELANQAAAKLKNGGQGTAEGSITVTFADALTIAYANTLTLTSNSSTGMSVGVQDSYAGEAVSTDYRAEGGKLNGSMATDTVTKKTSVIVGGHAQQATLGPLSGNLDLSQGVTSYTCTATTLSLSNSFIEWHLTKV